MRKLILIIVFVLFSSTAHAFQMTLTLESYPPATLPIVSKIIDVPDPNDQLEISRQAVLLALSSEGWGLENFGGVLLFREPPEVIGHLYAVNELLDVSGILGYELNDEAIKYGLSQFRLNFHTDEWVERLSHDFCERADNYGVISGNMGGIWQQCAVPDWGKFMVTQVSGVVTGFVTDSNHIPIRGAKVKLWHKGSLINVTRTDVNGWYEFKGLEDGWYSIIARRWGYKRDKKTGIIKQSKPWGKNEYINLVLE